MNPAINFYCQPGFGTIEIGNKKIQVVPISIVDDEMLTKKFIPIQLPVPDFFPQLFFKRCLIFPEFSGNKFDLMVIHTGFNA